MTRVAEPIDAFVTEAVLARLERSDLSKLLDVSDNGDVASLVDEIEGVDLKLAELAAAWAADALTRPEWESARAVVLDRRQRAQRRLDQMYRSSNAARAAGPGARDAWDELELDGRRAVIRELMPKGVVIKPIGKGRWRTFDPTTIVLGWFDN